MIAPRPSTIGASSENAVSEGWDPTNPMDTEQRLRELLVSRRLVGELDLSPSGSVFPMAKWVFIGATKARRLLAVAALSGCDSSVPGWRGWPLL